MTALHDGPSWKRGLLVIAPVTLWRRYVAQVISESTNQGAGSRPFYSWLESCLRHKGEMVIIEAARAIVSMPELTQRELQPAVTVLQLFLTSSKPVLRFAAVRTLNKVRASMHWLPNLPRACIGAIEAPDDATWDVWVAGGLYWSSAIPAAHLSL